MLQYNSSRAAKTRAPHLAHAAVVGIHALCCGAPAALALMGAALGAAVGGGVILKMHAWLHGYEPAVLALSFFLVVLGGIGEWRRRKSRRGFPALYALSLACLAVNVAVVAGHRLDPPAMVAAAPISR
ncbi:MAG: hypothetical protein AB7M12_05870 [Hyphomonadaceae bacterium]